MAFFLKYDVCFEADVLLSTVTYGGIFTGGCHVSISISYILRFRYIANYMIYMTKAVD